MFKVIIKNSGGMILNHMFIEYGMKHRIGEIWFKRKNNISVKSLNLN